MPLLCVSMHHINRGELCPSIPTSLWVNVTGLCLPVPGFGDESFVPPLRFLSPSRLSYCFAASQGNKQQQWRLGKARIFITLSCAEALKQLLQNKSPLRPFQSRVWLIAPGIKKSLFFPRQLAGTHSGDGSGSRHILATCGFSVCQKRDI